MLDISSLNFINYSVKTKNNKKGFMALESLTGIIISAIAFVFVVGLFYNTLLMMNPTNEKIVKGNVESIVEYVDYSSKQFSNNGNCFNLLKLTNLENFQIEKEHGEYIIFITDSYVKFIDKKKISNLYLVNRNEVAESGASTYTPDSTEDMNFNNDANYEIPTYDPDSAENMNFNNDIDYEAPKYNPDSTEDMNFDDNNVDYKMTTDTSDDLDYIEKINNINAKEYKFDEKVNLMYDDSSDSIITTSFYFWKVGEIYNKLELKKADFILLSPDTDNNQNTYNMEVSVNGALQPAKGKYLVFNPYSRELFLTKSDYSNTLVKFSTCAIKGFNLDKQNNFLSTSPDFADFIGEELHFDWKDEDGVEQKELFKWRYDKIVCPDGVENCQDYKRLPYDDFIQKISEYYKEKFNNLEGGRIAIVNRIKIPFKQIDQSILNKNEMYYDINKIFYEFEPVYKNFYEPSVEDIKIEEVNDESSVVVRNVDTSESRTQSDRTTAYIGGAKSKKTVSMSKKNLYKFTVNKEFNDKVYHKFKKIRVDKDCEHQYCDYIGYKNSRAYFYDNDFKKMVAFNTDYLYKNEEGNIYYRGAEVSNGEREKFDDIKISILGKNVNFIVFNIPVANDKEKTIVLSPYQLSQVREVVFKNE